MIDRRTLEAKVVGIVAEALSVDPAIVHLSSSLMDDLGAESIDFLDIVFRLETAFGIKIPESEIWEGTIDESTPESMKAAVARLRVQMPDFRWDRFPDPFNSADLPRLITVQTIVDYLARQDIP